MSVRRKVRKVGGLSVTLNPSLCCEKKLFDSREPWRAQSGGADTWRTEETDPPGGFSKGPE